MSSVSIKTIAILCNPFAGVGKAIALAEKIANELFQRQILYSLFKENWPTDFNGFTDVWISGGDGTLNYFVNHYHDIKLPLVIFNGGTGNDFHWLLYGKMSFEDQLQIALINEPRPIDIGRCNKKYFLNGAGIGFEGEVARSLTGKKKLPGKTSFMVMILKKIFSYRSGFYQVTVDGNALAVRKYLMIDVSNGSRAGGGFHVAPDAKADDGLFDVVMINALHPVKRLRWLPVIEKGKHVGRSFINYSTAKKVVIEADKVIQSHLDGEYYTATRLEIEILPGALSFRY
jgi:YegS/Rv2252/BmrU family lipid kinase